MITHRCSRCKKETNEIATIRIEKIIYGSMQQEKTEFDFCPNCAKELYKRTIKDLKIEEDV